MNDKVHYYTEKNGQMVRISKKEADKISESNKSLPFDRWREVKFVYMVKAERKERTV